MSDVTPQHCPHCQGAAIGYSLGGTFDEACPGVAPPLPEPRPPVIVQAFEADKGKGVIVCDTDEQIGAAVQSMLDLGYREVRAFNMGAAPAPPLGGAPPAPPRRLALVSPGVAQRGCSAQRWRSC